MELGSSRAQIEEDSHPIQYLRARPLRIFPLDPTIEHEFSIMSYNLMAQQHVSSEPDSLAPRPPGILKWSYRKQVLASELDTNSPDVACFQEMFNWKLFFEEFLSARGYKHRYIEKKPCGFDGCAIAWKAGLFELESYDEFEYTDSFVNVDDLDGLKVNVGQIAVLRHIKSSQLVLVANTHLYWKKERNDIRMLQTRTLLSRIDSMNACFSNDLSLILTGDFNASPNEECYALIMGHDFKSCYAVDGQEPTFTTYTSDFNGCLDYIFYKGRLARHSILLVPGEKMISTQGYLPNNIFGSDHLALCARFGLSFKKNEL